MPAAAPSPTAAPAKPAEAAKAADPKPAAPAAAAPATAAPAAPAAKPANKPLTHMRLAIAQQPLNIAVANLYIGKELGFFQEEGIDLEPISTAGGSESAQLVASSSAEAGYQQLDPLVLSAAKGQDLGLVFYYTVTRQLVFQLASKPDGGITSIDQLKGKTVGPSSPASTGLFCAKSSLRAVGIDPEKDVEYVSVGTGAQAADALYKGRVDALALWDAQYAVMENASFKLNYLQVPPGVADLWGGAGISVRRDWFQANQELAAGFGRAISKTTVFMKENPEASVKLHWKMFPELKPKGVDDETALKNELRVLMSRIDEFDPEKSGKIAKFGAVAPDEVATYAKWLGAEVPDLSKYYDMSLIDRINTFDAAQVRQMAKTYQVR